MISNFTLIRWVGVAAILTTVSIAGQAQPDYDFRNPTLISGIDLQVNAVYLFQNVKPGVDATVQIKDITGGIMLSDIDGPSGYVEALQPVLQVPAFASGYVEFQIDFLVAGTGMPMVQTEIPATPIDVDGQTYADGTVKEFDELQLINGYINYDMLGGELNMNVTSPWVKGYNVAAVDYPGVDTTPRQVMFTVVNAGISSFIFRTGATSDASAAHQRLRSIYFMKFAYADAFLPVSPLLSFSGYVAGEKTFLNWSVSANQSLKKVIIEKAGPSGQYDKLGEIATVPGTATTHYQFTDDKTGGQVSSYRLKLVDAADNWSYSNSLSFQAASLAAPAFKIYAVAGGSGQLRISFSSPAAQNATLRVFDLNGHAVYSRQLQAQEGINSMRVDGLSGLASGIYAAVLQMGGNSYGQKLMMR